MSRTSSIKHHPIVIALCAGVIMVGIFVVTGVIAVNEGAGWDGSVYLTYIERLGGGHTIVEDPYRSIRMGSFIPAIMVAAGFGLSRSSLLYVQLGVNIVVMSAALAFFYDFLRQYGVSGFVAKITTVTLLFTWPLLVMPVYYPVLSDHFTIAIVCFSLWLWARGLQPYLYVLCFWSPWVMPSLPLVPLVLAAMPRHQLIDSKNQNTKPGTPPRLYTPLARATLFLLLAVPSVVIGWQYLEQFSIEAIVTHAIGAGAELSTSLPQLRFWSAVAACASVVAAAWIWAYRLYQPALFRAVRVPSLLIATLVFIMSVVLMKTGLDWETGFKGPRLIENLALQALSAPFKPFVAHVITFGPVFILALLALFKHRYVGDIKPWALIALFAAFLPVLAWGSESRQWIAVLPVMVALVGMAHLKTQTRILFLLAGVVFCAPLFGLSEAVETAYKGGETLTTPNWQYYFGYQGPWMSADTYLLALPFVVALVLYCIVQSLRNHDFVETFRRVPFISTWLQFKNPSRAPDRLDQ